jgi:hypothetical protein
MKLPIGKPGLSRFVFVLLLLVFNWPLLSIPAPGSLFAWLFTAWGLAIVLLFLAAHRNGDREAGPVQPAEPGGPKPTGSGEGGGGV